MKKDTIECSGKLCTLDNGNTVSVNLAVDRKITKDVFITFYNKELDSKTEIRLTPEASSALCSLLQQVIYKI